VQRIVEPVPRARQRHGELPSLAKKPAPVIEH
jgi:hypothetical protein